MIIIIFFDLICSLSNTPGIMTPDSGNEEELEENDKFLIRQTGARRRPGPPARSARSWLEGSGSLERVRGLSGTRPNPHSMPPRTARRLLLNSLFARSIYSDSCMSVALFLVLCGRCRKWPRCQPERSSPCDRLWCGLSALRCRAPRRQCRSEGPDTLRSRVSSSCRSQQSISSWVAIRSQSRSRPRRSGTARTPADCCTDRPFANSVEHQLEIIQKGNMLKLMTVNICKINMRKNREVMWCAYRDKMGRHNRAKKFSSRSYRCFAYNWWRLDWNSSTEINWIIIIV